MRIGCSESNNADTGRRCLYFNPVVKQNGISRCCRTTGLSWTLLDVALNKKVNQRGELNSRAAEKKWKKNASAREAGSELDRAVGGRISWGRGKHQHTGGIYWFGGVWAGKPARVYAPKKKQKLTWSGIVEWRVVARQLWWRVDRGGGGRDQGERSVMVW